MENNKFLKLLTCAGISLAASTSAVNAISHSTLIEEEVYQASSVKPSLIILEEVIFEDSEQVRLSKNVGCSTNSTCNVNGSCK